MTGLCLALALAWGPAAPAQGQLAISADVRRTVALDDQPVLSVTVTGSMASLPDPQLPALPNFSVYSSGRSQNISFINGKVSSSVTHTFVLVPRAMGKAVIPPITVSAQGANAQTEPIEIQVVAPGATPQPGPGAAAPPAPSGHSPRIAGTPDVFLAAELDKKKAYVNEQVILSMKFFTAVNLAGNPDYSPPKIEGFLTEDLPPPRHYNTSIKGRPYAVTEIKTALFPLQTGRLRIGAATVRCQVPQEVDPFSPDFFDRFFSQGFLGGPAKSFSSQPLALEVEALPVAGKPVDFGGGVGRFSISASVDKNRCQVGDAVNLSVSIAGAGNLKALGQPALPALPAWRVFDSVTSVNQEKKGDLVEGSKVIRTVLVPRVSGELRIAPITLSYFDPGRRDYVQVQTRPLTVSVAPGAPGAQPAVGYMAPSAAVAKGLTKVNEDIAYLKTRPRTPVLTRILDSAASAGPLHALPWLFFLGLAGHALHLRRQASDPKGARLRGALKKAMEKIRKSEQATDKQQAAALLTEALTGFLADKLGAPASGLTMRRIQGGNISAPALQRIQALWDELDALRFAPSAADEASRQDPLRAQLIELLKDLEQEFKR